MRVTDSMMYTEAITNIDQEQSTVQSLTQQSSTGIAVNSPWDNPAAAGRAVTLQISGARFGAIANATTDAANELSSADDALNTIETSVQQAITLATELGSGVQTTSQQTAAVEQITGIQNEIVAALNTQVGNRYIFGGTLDSAPPFDAAGNYSGNAQVRQVEVAPGIYQNASVNVSVAVKGTGGGQDLFAALSALSTALSTGNNAAIFAAEAPLTTALQQINQARSQEGGDSDALQAASSLSTQTQAVQTTASANAVDIDEVTVATQLSQAQTTLQAAIDASSKTFQLPFVGDTQQGT